MRNEEMMFSGAAGIKMFLDNDIYRLKETLPVAEKKEEKPIEEVKSLFVETPSLPNVRPTVKLLILVENVAKTNGSAKDMEFLTKLVNAVGVHMKDVSIKSMEEAQAVDAKKVLLFIASTDAFSSSPLFEGFNQEFIKYSPLTVYNQQIIWADALESIHDAVEMKKSLWTALKAMFGLA